MNQVFGKSEGIQFIKKCIETELPAFIFYNEHTENNPNNAFALVYKYSDYTIEFIQDRGYLEVQIVYESKGVNLFRFDKSVGNTYFNEDGVINIINKLKKIL